MKKLLAILIITFSVLSLSAQSPVGKWDTYDDETGEKKSLIEIYKVGDKLYGKIIKIYDQTKSDAKCTSCTGDKKDKAIVGMIIMEDLEKDDDEWDDGEILDPNNGKIYDCKIWLESNEVLKVRGYVGLFYRTQTWKKVN